MMPRVCINSIDLANKNVKKKYVPIILFQFWDYKLKRLDSFLIWYQKNEIVINSIMQNSYIGK